MTSFTNHTAGPKGINLKPGASHDGASGTVWLEPGQTADIDAGSILGEVPDLGKPGDEAEQNAASLAEANATIAQLRGRIAELEAMVSKPKPVGLTGKNKDQLMQIAADEGATVPDGATVNDIIAAIEAKREAV